tara:strand:- start:379 stop:600 length:222 start_codon:yes stop_codon:yes gene_type:complete
MMNIKAARKEALDRASSDSITLDAEGLLEETLYCMVEVDAEWHQVTSENYDKARRIAGKMPKSFWLSQGSVAS